MRIPEHVKQHPDWPRNYEAGRQAFLDGLRNRLEVRRRYHATATNSGHLGVRMTAWREGYAAAAKAAGADVGTSLDSVG
jgi:hypothetical protein